MLASRGFNIDSLAVGETEVPDLSRMTFVVHGDDAELEQLRKQLDKVVTVVKVVDISSENFVECDLMLVKVRSNPAQRVEVSLLVEMFRGRVVDITHDTLLIEVSGQEGKIEAFIDLMRPYGIVELRGPAESPWSVATWERTPNCESSADDYFDDAQAVARAGCSPATLVPGQKIRIVQTIRVGAKKWQATVEGAFRELNYLATGLTTDAFPRTTSSCRSFISEVRRRTVEHRPRRKHEGGCSYVELTPVHPGQIASLLGCLDSEGWRDCRFLLSVACVRTGGDLRYRIPDTRRPPTIFPTGSLFMPRVQQFVEFLGAALCEHATAALARLVPFETTLLDVARALHRRTVTAMQPRELRASLRELVSSPAETVELAIHDGVSAIRPDVPEEFRDSLIQYLELLPEVIRQALCRPGDPDGESVPEQFVVRRAEDWLLFLPDRLPTFRPGDVPNGVDNWRIGELRGLGPHAEVWNGYDDEQPELSPACLKFVTDAKARDSFVKHVPLLKRVLDLDVIHGLIPLRSAYVLATPPCLEYVHLPGYDLANLMRDARWRNDRPRPQQAALIARRVARVAGKLHRLNPPLVHRGLKPSNVLLCPTTEGKVTVWVSDVGWGQITAAVEDGRVDVAQAIRRSLRGSHGRLYASPQLRAGGPPDPRDDVYAIGMLWYQLLRQDPMARPPSSETWAVEFRRHGLTDGQARLISACLAEVPANRPGDGQALADLIAANTTSVRTGDSATIRLRGSTTHEVRKFNTAADAPRLRVRSTAEADDDDDELD